MRQRTISVLIGLIIGGAVLAGCARTPEDALVKQKGEASLKNYEEAETLKSQEDSTGAEKSSDTADTGTDDNGDVANVLRQRLDVPEHYQSEVSDETGKLQILTDAAVEVPDVRKVPAIAVSQHPFDQTVIDRITDTFFPEAVIYSGSSYYTMTKEDYQKMIEGLKGYVAEGNLDPFDYGTDENGNYCFDIYGNIEAAEKMYEEAPESRTLEEVHPQFGLLEEAPDYFDGVACLPDETAYDYTLKSYDSMPMEVQIKKKRQSENYGAMIDWTEYKGLKASVEDVPDEEEIRQEIGISLEDAQRIADEKVAALELDHMEMTSWEYGICWEGESGYTRKGLKDLGYVLHYTRRLEGIPVTYTMEWGGNLESMDSDMQTWGYERLDFIITKDGIDTVDFCNQYDIGETRTENLSLLPFEKIMEIYEKMMVIQNADIINYEAARSYRIDRITFGFSRIYEPSTDSRSGLLVPVWDFFGSFETQYEEQMQQYDYINAVEYQSYLTINAIDGSVIDRGLGY